jgi:hypothetical protein
MDLRDTMTRVRSEEHGDVFDNHDARSGEQHRRVTATFDQMTIGRLAETGVTDGWECLDVGFLSAKKALMRHAGGDPEHIAQAAGLVDIDPRPHVRTRGWGSADLRLQISHVYHLRDGFVSVGMTEEEPAEVRAVMCDPPFRASSSLMYSVQCRKERQE